MAAIRGFAELTDRLLTAAGQQAAEPARQGRRELLDWSCRIVAGALDSASDEPDELTVRIASRVQSLVHFLDLLDGYDPELIDRPRPSELVAAAARRIERDCALLLGPAGPGQRRVRRRGRRTDHADRRRPALDLGVARRRIRSRGVTPTGPLPTRGGYVVSATDRLPAVVGLPR